MRIRRTILCLILLALCARMIPYEPAASMLTDILLIDSVADTEEMEDTETGQSPKDRHPVGIGCPQDYYSCLARVLNRVALEGDRIGDRGADDIHTPPPERWG